MTQNIDALHEAAGTKNLIHMHGELGKALCARCGAEPALGGRSVDRDALLRLLARRRDAP